ncbi:MAG: YcnI family protein [Rhodoglobus sp.]
MNRYVSTAAALATAVTLSLLAPLAASAHITIDPGQAVAGSYTVLTVRVPNESETAGTNRVELSLPTKTPFAYVGYVPVTGWSVELVREKLPKPVTVGDSEITEAVTSVIWTAQAGSEVTAGQLQLFSLSVGPVPDTGSITLPADQSYTDGTVVSWSENGEDSKHPAPVLYVNDSPETGSHHGGAESDEKGHHKATVSSDGQHSESGATDVLARVLGIGGLILGVAGVVFGFTARRPAKK